MKKITYIFSLLLLVITFQNCVEPIEILDTNNDDFLVVQSTISNELRFQTVKLTRTFSLNARTDEEIKESNATVTIKSNTNTYSFTESKEGIYISDKEFKAEPNKEYTLEIKTAKGKTYKSRPEKLTGSSEISEIIPKKETNNLNEEGIRIYVKGNGLDNNSKYFKYEYIETYKIVAPFWSDSKLEIVSENLPYKVKVVPDFEKSRICYKSENSIEIIQKETSVLSEGAIDFGLKFIPKKSFSISHRYSILVKQHVQSFEAYNYYKTLNKLSTDNNLFSQSQPGFIQGNITSTTNINNKVVGFFEVTSVTSKRIFFNREEFFSIDEPADFVNKCNFIAPVLTEAFGGIFRSPLISTLKSNSFLFYKENNSVSVSLPGPYILVRKVCRDCRETGTNVKPNFWID